MDLANGFRQARAAGLYAADKADRKSQKPQDNYLVDQCYKESFGGAPGSHQAHENFHTHYQNRADLLDAKMDVLDGKGAKKLPVCVIVGAEEVTDEQAASLSTEIAQKIQEEMTYPGQVKITVIRETRSVAFAK